MEGVRTTFYITSAQGRLLRRLARERDVSVASLVRDAIDAHLPPDSTPKKKRSDKKRRRKVEQTS